MKIKLYIKQTFVLCALFMSAVPYTVAAATPDIRLTQGVVSKTSSNETFVPPTVGPVAVSAVGSVGCSRFSPAGVINSNQIAGQPFNSDTSGYIQNNNYTIVGTIENYDSVPVYEIRYKFQASFFAGADSSNLCLVKGDGTVLVNNVDYLTLSLGFDTVEILLLPTSAGTLNAYSATSGSNIVFVTFDVGLYGSDNILLYPTPDVINEGSITRASLTPSGPNNLVGVVADTTTMGIKNFMSVSSSIASSSLMFTVSGITIGEIVTYRVEIRVPEGGTTTEALILNDVLPSNMVIYDNNGVNTNPVTVTASSSLLEFPSGNPLTFFTTVYNTGTRPYILIDSLQNIDTNVATEEKIVIEYSAVLNSNPGFAATTSSFLVNTPILSYEIARNSYNLAGSGATSTPNEPNLILRNMSTSTVNASSSARFNFELFHTGDRLSDAQDVVFYLQTDGPGLLPATISDVVVTGLAPATTTIGSLLLSWPSIPTTFSSTSPITISFIATLTTATTSTTTLAYPVGLYSWSTPGGSLTPLSSFSPNSHARAYAGTTTMSSIFGPLAVMGTSTPVATTSPIIGGGTYNNPGCMDLFAINYDKWATSNNGSCKYPEGATTSPSVLPIQGGTTSPALSNDLIPIIASSSIASSTITYIPSNKKKLFLEITGALSYGNSKIRSLARMQAKKDGASIVIPALKIQQPILILPTLKPLLNEAWILPDGSTPDKGGNTILVGHSFNSIKKVKSQNTFFNLDALKIAEKIELAWKGKTYVYQVVDNDQFSPENVWIEDNTVESILTIYTCGKYTTSYRQVVRASLIEVKDTR